MSTLFTTALVRDLPDSYRIYDRPDRPMSLELARRQHQAYVHTLEQIGLVVRHIPADENQYDCVFIEDTAVVWKAHALLTRMVPRRQGEQPAVQARLSETHHVDHCRPESKLEGGDVLHTGDTTYVGLTERTNEAGIRDLTLFLSPYHRPVVPVPVRGCLHLKSAATYLGNNALVAVPDFVDVQVFAVDEVIYTAEGEAGAANCLRIGQHLLMPAGYPRTEEKLRHFCAQHGVQLWPLDVSEIEKGDGALTCCSLRW